MTKEELIALGRKIVNCEGTEDEVDEMYELFSKNVPHPDGAGLLFYPEKFNANMHKSSDFKPTIEQIVDLALSYKPINL